MQMSGMVSAGMLAYQSGRADPRLAVEGRHREKQQPIEQKSLDDVACSPLDVRLREWCTVMGRACICGRPSSERAPGAIKDHQIGRQRHAVKPQKQPSMQ